jgi:hypothetical protein
MIRSTQDLEEALSLFREIGDLGGAALALNELDTLNRICGEVALAQQFYRQSLNLCRDLGSALGETRALAGLGRCALAEDQTTERKNLLQQALAHFQQLSAAEAPDVLAELEALNDP